MSQTLPEAVVHAQGEILQITDAMPQLVWSAQPDGTIDYFNLRWIEYTGLHIDDLLTEGIKGVVHPDELDETWKRWNAAIAHQQPYEIEYRLRCAADGTYRWFLGRAVPLFDEQHRLVRWIGTATDIDDAKQIGERALQRLHVISHISRLLFEMHDLPTMFSEIAQSIVSDMADGCLIATIDDDVFRVVEARHRDPLLQPAIAAFRGQRALQPDVEQAMIERIRKHEPFVRQHAEIESLRQSVWPYLMHAVEQLNPTSSIAIPLYSHGMTYGAIFVYYTGLGRVYSDEDVPALVEVGQRISLAIESARLLQRERKIAQTLQHASLPTLIPKPSGILFDAVYSPAGEESAVGGDWYDAIELDDGSVVISVGDVTGRGLEAAVIMSKVRHAMGVVPRHDPDPANILDSAEWFLGKRYPDAIVTAFAGVISADRKKLRFANAGHPPPFLCRHGELIELRAPGLPLGVRRLSTHEPSQEYDLEEDDLLVLYTDGLVEWGKDHNEGSALLRRILQTDAIHVTRRPAKMIATACIEENSTDDVAVLAVSLRPSAEWSFLADNAQAAQFVRQDLIEYLQRHVDDPAFIKTAEMVFGELIGNVVRHAPGPAEIYLTWEPDAAVIHVLDSGPRFSSRSKLPHTFSEHGRGLYIICQSVSKFHVEHIENYGNHVSVYLPA